ncbi:MAG TPA: ABC transporter ATP-binding protein [Candidatus Binataceae bacterium]|nr:ABC transporter ATP-binding protein [Candidatus Binataceae bacterium]
MSDEIVLVSGLTKRFDKVSAVDNLSFTAQKGEILGLVGPDGAGKTTTLRILAGVLAADGGSALLAGQDVLADPESVKSRISYMPQHFGLYEDLTVAENIRFYADIFEVSRAEREQREQQLLAACGMSPFRDRLAGQLSGGMKRKLGIACALIHTPQLLLLDEPTTGVDPVSRRELWSILYSLVFENVTVLVSTAYLDEAERCHRLLLMHQGRRMFFGTPDELKEMLPGAVLSVSSADPQTLQAAAAGEEGVLSATAMGDALHVVVDDVDRRAAQLRARFERDRLPFGDLRRIPASVEDVFVYAISQQAAKGS